MKISQIAIYAGWYFLGFVTPPLILLILFFSGWEPPLTESDILLSKWHITEENPNLLIVDLIDYDNMPLTIGIEIDSQTSLVKEAGIVRNANAKFSALPLSLVYTFRDKRYLPMVCYGSPDIAIVWKDLNCDSQFDQMFNYAIGEANINVDGQWIKWIKTNDSNEVFEAITEKGIFAFDPNVGNWIRVDPNTAP